MRFFRRQHRVFGWLAALAILLASLAPMVSHAMANDSDTSIFEVCSVQGPKAVQPPTSDPSEDGGDVGHRLLVHCAYCTLHFPVMDLPPATVDGLPAPELAVQGSLASCANVPIQRAHATAQSRAPPPSS